MIGNGSLITPHLSFQVPGFVCLLADAKGEKEEGKTVPSWIPTPVPCKYLLQNHNIHISTTTTSSGSDPLWSFAFASGLTG